MFIVIFTLKHVSLFVLVALITYFANILTGKLPKLACSVASITPPKKKEKKRIKNSNLSGPGATGC